MLHCPRCSCQLVVHQLHQDSEQAHDCPEKMGKVVPIHTQHCPLPAMEVAPHSYPSTCLPTTCPPTKCPPSLGHAARLAIHRAMEGCVVDSDKAIQQLCLPSKLNAFLESYSLGI